MTGELEWREGEPWSPRYRDVFFARGGGLAEAEHVFLAGNRLAPRFASLSPGDTFEIGETGFGTGLNFLAATALFMRCAPSGARLSYVSAEAHPLSRDDLVRSAALWPELAVHARDLTSLWHAFVPGFHRLRLAEGRIALTLLVGDATAQLAALEGTMNAWFLDGFAPDRNPEMWSPALFHEIARCSQQGTTLATYSVAGAVRRGLEAAGFSLSKHPGYGRKREMLVGTFARGVPPRTPRSSIRRVAVIGAGLAGAAAAASLASRGLAVTLYERGATAAAGASGNPQGVLYVRLSGHDTPLRRLLLASYQHALRELPRLLGDEGDRWHRCGVLQLAFDADEAKRQALLLAATLPPEVLATVDATQASALAGVPIGSPGLHFPGGGWVHPPALVRALLAHENIRLRLATDVRELQARDHRWAVLSAEGSDAVDAVVLATAQAANALLPRPLPLRAIAGQISLLPATPESRALRGVICGRGYVAPAREGAHTLGATHRMNEASTDLRAEDHAANLRALETLCPALARSLGSLDASPLSGRAAVRCTSPDTLPIAGMVEPGLYITTAHGSRGLVTTLLAGELIASTVAGEALPLTRQLVQALSPARYAGRHEGRSLWHHRGSANAETRR